MPAINASRRSGLFWRMHCSDQQGRRSMPNSPVQLRVTDNPEPAPLMSLFNRLTAFSTQSGRAIGLVWATSRPLFSGLIVATLIAGILPALAAWIGQRIVDAVVEAMQIHGNGSQAPVWPVLRYVLAEAGVLTLLAAAQRALNATSAAAGTVGAEGQPDDPGKSPDPFAAAIRGLRLLRQVGARAPRCINPTTGPRHKGLGLTQNLISLVSFAVLLVHFPRGRC